jgi:hypothetical protein
MNHASAIKFIKDHKDTPRFAILPIDEKTFPQLKMIRKFGKDNTYELVLQGLYEMFQIDGFNKTTNPDDGDAIADSIAQEAAKFLNGAIYRFLPKFTEDEEITAWNLFVNESEFMKKLCEDLGLNYNKWMLDSLTIYDNTYDNLMTMFKSELDPLFSSPMDEFVRQNIEGDSEYFFGDKWFVCIKEKAYSENTPTDMVNTLLTKFFEDNELRDKIFNAWQNWMYEHHDYITGRTNSK